MCDDATFETTFILFADMLGFADLVEREGDEVNKLNPIFTGSELYSPSPAENLLGYRFINFHRCLNEARVRLQEMGAGTAIVLSDSAFFRIETLENAIHLARTLMVAKENFAMWCRVKNEFGDWGSRFSLQAGLR
jgi:hypothetical protein